MQFKRFLLDNFSIKYVIKSNAEHWFSYSQVSTIFIVLEKKNKNTKTKFVTLNFKLQDYFSEENNNEHIKLTENLYNQIDFCDLPENTEWKKDEFFSTVFHKKDSLVKVSIVDKEHLINSLTNQESWDINFIAQNPISIFKKSLIKPFPDLMDVGRGTRTGQDKMFLLNKKQIEELEIEDIFLQPTLKSSRYLTQIDNNTKPDNYLFLCNEPLERLIKDFPNAYKWIDKWKTTKNKTGKLLTTVLKNNKPYWYSLKAEEPANIYISINPDRKLFFSYSDKSINLNQRLIAIRTKKDDIKIITALFNSIVGLLIVELNGISRNLGALDLNADFFKTKMRILDPRLLTKKEKQLIIKKFNPLSKRNIENYNIELKSKDRIEFDKTVLKCFGYDIKLLDKLYQILNDRITNRVEMKNR